MYYSMIRSVSNDSNDGLVVEHWCHSVTSWEKKTNNVASSLNVLHNSSEVRVAATQAKARSQDLGPLTCFQQLPQANGNQRRPEAALVQARFIHQACVSNSRWWT